MTFLNVIWLVFGGLWLALGYLLAALICFLLIVTIPFGFASLRIASYALWPFGRTIVERPGAGTGSLVGHDLKALGIPALSDYVDAYVARTGLDPRPHLAVYLAYNFFRLAAILQGIVGRVRDGTATNENAPARARMVRPLAMTAWEFAREAGAK